MQAVNFYFYFFLQNCICSGFMAGIIWTLCTCKLLILFFVDQVAVKFTEKMPDMPNIRVVSRRCSLCNLFHFNHILQMTFQLASCFDLCTKSYLGNHLHRSVMLGLLEMHWCCADRSQSTAREQFKSIKSSPIALVELWYHMPIGLHSGNASRAYLLSFSLVI